MRRLWIVVLISAALITKTVTAGDSSSADSQTAKTSTDSGGSRAEGKVDGPRMGEAHGKTGSNKTNGPDAGDAAEQTSSWIAWAAGLVQSWIATSETEEALRRHTPQRVFYSSPVFFMFLAAMLKPPITLAVMGLPDEAGYLFVGEEPFWKYFVKQNGPPFCLLLMAVYGSCSDLRDLLMAWRSGLPWLEFLGITCIVLAFTGNIGALLSVLMTYCAYSDRFDGEDGKNYLFGEAPHCCGLEDRLNLIVMLFGVPKWFEARPLERMVPASRMLLYYLHVVYLPIIRVLSIAAFVVGVMYCWFALPMGFLTLGILHCMNPVMEQLIIWKLGADRKYEADKVRNTIRWNLVLPVCMVPLLPLLVSVGVRFALGEGYMPALLNSLLHPTLVDYVQHHAETLTKTQESLNALYVVV